MTSLRNSAEALRWAETANALSDGQMPFVLDALGMAYAATDQYEEARKSVEAALRLERAAGHDFAASNLQSRLNLYEVRKPYREALRPDALPMEPRWDAGEALPRTVSPASSTPAVTAKTNSP